MATFTAGTVTIHGIRFSDWALPIGAVLDIESAPGVTSPFVLLQDVALLASGLDGTDNGVTVNVRGHFPGGWVPSGEVVTIYMVRGDLGIFHCTVHGPFTSDWYEEAPFLSVVNPAEGRWSKCDFVSVDSISATTLRVLFTGQTLTGSLPTYTLALEDVLGNAALYSFQTGYGPDPATSGEPTVLAVQIDEYDPSSIYITTTAREPGLTYALQHPLYDYYWPFDRYAPDETFIPADGVISGRVPGMYAMAVPGLLRLTMVGGAVIDQPVDLVIALGAVDTPSLRAELAAMIEAAYAASSWPGAMGPTAEGMTSYLQGEGYDLTVTSISASEPLSMSHRLVFGSVDFGEAPVVPMQPLLGAALALLPPGRAWSRRLSSMLARVLDALVTEPGRVHAEARELLRSISPRRAERVDYVEAWEEALGITDPIGVYTDRALAVATKLRGAPPDRSLAAWQAAAVARGMELTALEVAFAPFRAGISAAGDPAASDAFAYAFIAHVTGEAGPTADALLADFAALQRAHTAVRLELTLGGV